MVLLKLYLENKYINGKKNKNLKKLGVSNIFNHARN